MFSISRLRLALGVGVIGFLLSFPSVATPGWSTETVDGADDTGFFNSLAFNPVSGLPAIAYSAPAKGNQTTIKLTEWNGASWSTQAITTGKGFNGGISLAFDPSGNPAVSCTLGGLKFARRTGSTWIVQTVDGQSGGTVSSLVYANGSFWIAYYTSTALKLGRLVGSSWSTEPVDGSGMMYPSLAFAPDSNPSIAYRFGTANSLKFAHKSGSTWTVQTVETGAAGGLGGYGVFASLAYDPLTGNPTISHSNGSVTNLRFVRWDGFQWVVEIAATGHATHSSLAYDAAGIAAISYDFAPAGTTNQLWLARRTGCGGTCWEDTLIKDEAPLSVQWRTSLAFSPTGAAAISYGVAYPRNLKFAQELP